MTSFSGAESETTRGLCAEVFGATAFAVLFTVYVCSGICDFLCRLRLLFAFASLTAQAYYGAVNSGPAPEISTLTLIDAKGGTP